MSIFYSIFNTNTALPGETAAPLNTVINQLMYSVFWGDTAPPPAAPIVQAVGMRSEITSSTYQGTAGARTDVVNNNRCRIYMPDTEVTNIKIGFAGWKHQVGSLTGEQLMNNAFTVQHALENAAGTVNHPVTWDGGSATKTINPADETYFSDVVLDSTTGLPLTTSALEELFLRSTITVASETLFFPRLNDPWTWAGAGTFTEYGPAGTPSQVTGVGAMTASAGGTIGSRGHPGATIIIGTPATPIVSVAVVFGNSIPVGQGDVSFTSTGAYGFVRQALHTNKTSYGMFSVPQNRLEYETPALSANKRALMPYYTHAISLGTGNDVSAAGSVAATVISRFDERMSFLKSVTTPYGEPMKVMVITDPPRTTSTDSWATLANQTPVANYTNETLPAKSNRDAVNDDIRSKEGVAYDYLFDVCTYFEHNPIVGGTDHGKWIVDGTPNYPTNDNTHPRSALVDIAAPPLAAVIGGWVPINPSVPASALRADDAGTKIHYFDDAQTKVWNTQD